MRENMRFLIFLVMSMLLGFSGLVPAIGLGLGVFDDTPALWNVGVLISATSILLIGVAQHWYDAR